MNYTRKVLLSLLLVFILPALFLLLVGRPRAREYSRLQAQEKKLNHEIMAAQREVNLLPDTMKEIEFLRGRLARLKRQYPRTIEPFYEQISGTAKKVGLDILSMVSVSSPHPEKKEQAVEERFVQIEARCSYQVLGEFLDELSQLPVAVSISALTLAGKKSSLPQLEVEMRLTTYLSREE